MNNAPAKSFWEKPEGKTGVLVIVLLGAAAAVGLYWALPFLIALAANTLTLMGLLAAIAAILYLVMNKQFRLNVSMLFKITMRAMTGMIINIDPIAILKNYVRDLYENLEEMNTQLGNLKGVMIRLKRKMDEIKDEIDKHMRLAQTATKKNNKQQAILNNRAAERRKTSYKKLNNLYKKMEMIYKVLVKMFKNCELLAKDTEDDVNIKEQEWKAIKATSKTVKSAMSIVNGDLDQRAMYEQTLEMMADEMGAKLGEMEHFMDMSAGLMESIDLESESFDDNMLQNLEEWGKSSDSWILGEEKQAIVAEAESDSEFDPEAAETIDATSVEKIRTQKINLFSS